MAVKTARTRIIRRWRKNMDVPDDTAYVDMLTTLSEGSVRRNFNPYTDIDWDSPEFAVIAERRALDPAATDPIGKHAWYQAQPTERQIEIGMWRQANVAKVGLHFESILIRGLMEYAFWTPNGSPEYRYCLHEAVEECNHTMMFQEMVNRIGADVPGMPRMLKWLQPLIPLVGRPAADPVLVRHPRRRGAHRPHAEERAARGQGPAPDHGAGHGHSRRRGGAAHLVRARVPAQAGAAPAAAASASVLSLLRADRSCGSCARRSSCRRGRSGRNSTSRARCARTSSSGRPSRDRCCATCSATSGCCATTPA